MCHCAKENRKTMMMHHDRLLITLTVCLRKMNIIDIGYGMGFITVHCKNYTMKTVSWIPRFFNFNQFGKEIWKQKAFSISIYSVVMLSVALFDLKNGLFKFWMLLYHFHSYFRNLSKFLLLLNLDSECVWGKEKNKWTFHMYNILLSVLVSFLLLCLG